MTCFDDELWWRIRSWTRPLDTNLQLHLVMVCCYKWNDYQGNLLTERDGEGWTWWTTAYWLCKRRGPSLSLYANWQVYQLQLDSSTYMKIALVKFSESHNKQRSSECKKWIYGIRDRWKGLGNESNQNELQLPWQYQRIALRLKNHTYAQTVLFNSYKVLILAG